MIESLDISKETASSQTAFHPSAEKSSARIEYFSYPLRNPVEIGKSSLKKMRFEL